MNSARIYTLDFSDIRLEDVPIVGGKNASLGELFKALRSEGLGVVDGFATTADAYWRLLCERGLRESLESIFTKLDPDDLSQLARRGHDARTAVLNTPIPDEIRVPVLASYRRLVS